MGDLEDDVCDEERQAPMYPMSIPASTPQVCMPNSFTDETAEMVRKTSSNLRVFRVTSPTRDVSESKSSNPDSESPPKVSESNMERVPRRRTMASIWGYKKGSEGEEFDGDACSSTRGPDDMAPPVGHQGTWHWKKSSSQKLQVASSRDAEGKEAQRDQLVSVAGPYLTKMKQNMCGSMKQGILGDPDMWPWCKSLAEVIIDSLWADVESEFKRRFEITIKRGRPSPADFEDIEGPPQDGGRCYNLWLRLRAYTLFHYLAHDKSFFGKLKDPVHIVILFATTVPIAGLRVIFFAMVLGMLLFPGPPDEFQLVNYILVFKGTQFVTAGLLNLSSGAFRHFMCYTLRKDSLLDCVERHGPGAKVSTGDIINYIGSVALVWIAFSKLSISKKTQIVKPVSDSTFQPENSQGLASPKITESRPPSESNSYSAPAVQDTWKRLRYLLWCDVACFTLSLFVLLILSILAVAVYYSRHGNLSGIGTERQFHANIFWANTIYSLLSLPFFAMKWVPGALALLTHTTITGYNTHGACVPHCLKPSPEIEKEELDRQSNPPMWADGIFARRLTQVLAFAEKGRKVRGEEPDGEFKVSDVVTGFFAPVVKHFEKMRKGKRRQKEEDDVTDEGGTSESGAVLSPETMPKKGALKSSENLRRRNSSKKPASFASEESRPITPNSPSEIEDPSDTEPLHGTLLIASGSEIVIASVMLPASGVSQSSEGKQVFEIKVTPEHGKEWSISKRYSEFRDLFVKLGSYQQVPFPQKHVVHRGELQGEKLHHRRKGLEKWLREVVKNVQSQDDTWPGHVSEFLEIDANFVAEETTSPATMVWDPLSQQQEADHMMLQKASEQQELDLRERVKERAWQELDLRERVKERVKDHHPDEEFDVDPRAEELY